MHDKQYHLTGDKLRLIRSFANISQTQFADLLGIERKSISRWESGQSNPTATSAAKVVSFVGKETFQRIEAILYDLGNVEMMDKLRTKVNNRL
ncbi:helix-turn-helix transcriptional regulator [Bacillus cereus group sp. TH260-2LC]|uniref:helix-turn-helix transcriptional regulator n=1 Tax=unclassified Bacillus cereus group TaxID=2750818 RepID=UPI0022E6184C|nr:helix-turn-helix transcriptional regulator [Bacillus cereus group sp. TH260-2LC]MDA1527235.1 helix-turn-helix transcriptional regulator [Bacillus cereus group sp. TH260-2LC]